MAHGKILRVVGQMLARTVVGPELCRHPDWVESVIGYSQNVFMAAVYMKLVPKFMIPMVAYLTPYRYRIYSNIRKIRKILYPTLKQRLEMARDHPENWAVKVKTEQMYTLDWLVQTSPPAEATLEMISHRITGVSFGGSHTTSNHVFNSVLEMAADFDRWAIPLREEIDEVLGDKKEITNADLSKMWKLDSFMKEAQRFHPPSKCKSAQSHTPLLL